MSNNVSNANEKGLARFFEFSKHGTNYRREILAGITTFLAMAYILAVNPITLTADGATGMDYGAVFTATAIASIIGTLIMGLYAKYPIALAPGMGLNAFFAYTVVLGMGIPWQQALAGVFVSGIIFLILAISGLREVVINAIPAGMKYAVSAGIGLFIAFIGLQNGGIIVDNPATLVSLGSFEEPGTLLALFGIVVTAVLMTRKINGAIFYGIVITAIVGMIFGLVQVPDRVVSAPPSASGFMAFWEPFTDPSIMFSGTMLIVIFTFLFVDFFDTAGTLVGVASQAGLMQGDKLPRAGRALAADSVATIAGAAVGTSTTTSYIESSAGVAAGGRTGLTAIVTAICFALALFFSPVLSVITSEVTAAALVMVGVLMAANLAKINWQDISEAAPAFITAVTMPLAYSISTGIALGFILYPLTKIIRGEGKQVHPIMYLLFVVFLLYFIFLRE
mgnify:CR=1 FL=1